MQLYLPQYSQPQRYQLLALLSIQPLSSPTQLYHDLPVVESGHPHFLLLRREGNTRNLSDEELELAFSSLKDEVKEQYPDDPPDVQVFKPEFMIWVFIYTPPRARNMIFPGVLIPGIDKWAMYRKFSVTIQKMKETARSHTLHRIRETGCADPSNPGQAVARLTGPMPEVIQRKGAPRPSDQKDKQKTENLMIHFWEMEEKIARLGETVDKLLESIHGTKDGASTERERVENPSGGDNKRRKLG